MKRQIKFRGQRCSLAYEGQDKWVYGYYVESNRSWKGRKPHKSWILDSPMTNGGWFAFCGKTAVKDDTVGQFTGFYDNSDLIDDKKEKKPIYEGDVVLIYDDDLVVVGNGSVEFLDECGLWYVDGEGEANNGLCDIRQSFYLQVIGNIYDQPEFE